MSGGERRILVIGLPQTGKTTFIAALWHVVDYQEVASSLELEKLEGEKQYLNEIRDFWANCQPIERSKLSKECIVSMKLRDVATGVRSDVSFPDMYGESFERQWTERIWSSAYRNLVRDATGALLFIHPSKVKEAPLICDALPLMKRLSGAEVKNDESEQPKAESAGAQTMPAEPVYAPTQVQLVELLQFIRVPKEDLIGFRLGVIISAWDLVQNQGRVTPDSWLEKRLPLLHQFLMTNSDTISFRVFGVSAQGGDLQDAEKLRKKHRPSDRIIVVQGGQRSHDITLPVRWAMGGSGDQGDL